MRDKIDCFLPQGESQATEDTVAQLRNNKTVQRVICLDKSLMASSTLMQVAENAKAEYVLLLTKPVRVTLGQGSLDRMLRVASDSNAVMVYSDHIERKEESGKWKEERHPAIDYYVGSIRDDFDFGSLWLVKTALLHTFAM